MSGATKPKVTPLASFSVLAEPTLAFHPDRPEDRDVHPLRGLLNYGPFSRSLIAGVLDPIRVAAVGPRGVMAQLKVLLGELELSLIHI